jgi:hypothetical protein
MNVSDHSSSSIIIHHHPSSIITNQPQIHRRLLILQLETFGGIFIGEELSQFLVIVTLLFHQCLHHAFATPLIESRDGFQLQLGMILEGVFFVSIVG